MAFNENVCRLCLQENAFHLIWEGNPGLSQRIASFCQLEIAIDDGLSSFICDICNSTLSKMASLYERCHLVDQILRAKHQEATPSKSVKFEFSSCSSPVAGSENSFGSCDIYDEELPLSCIIKTENDSHVSIKATDSIKNLCATNKNREKSTNCLCSFCGKVYNSSKSLNIHIKTHRDLRSGDDKSRKKCNLVFKLERFKKRTAKRRYPCEVCGKMFKSVGDVKRHKNTVHTKSCSVECLVCLKKLASQQSLKRHLKIHSNEREFECDHCRRKFNSKPCLVLHMRTHTGEKPYKCKHCDKSFSIHKSLREHERLHTGERPYACPICFKGFSQKSNMKSHFRYNHKEKQLQ